MIDVRNLPSVPLVQRNKLPDLMAVYVVVGRTDEILYVGSTESLRTRWKSHHRRFQMKNIVQARIHWFEVKDPTRLRDTEAEWIARLSPALNGQTVTDAPTVMVAALIAPETKRALEILAEREDRTISNMIR